MSWKLLLKQLAVGTPVGSLAQRARWIVQAPQRLRHPELWDLYLEDRRTQVALEWLIGPDDNCVDVGAHIGSILVEMRRLAPNGSHLAVEPVPAKARWLRRRFRDVPIIEAATSDEAGAALFFHDLDRPGFSGLRQPVEDSTVRTYEVRVISLDDELGDRDRIDFLKVDVEGAELPTLRGADTIINRHKPAVMFECGTDPQLQRFGYKRSDLFGFFAERGYDVYAMVDIVYGREPMTREAFDKAGTYPYRGFNYVALPAGVEVKRLL